MAPVRVVLALTAVAVVAACGGSSGGDSAGARYRSDSVLRLNQVQVLGTHNSYHVEAPEDLRNLLGLVDPELVERTGYGHPPLPVQLDREGVRSVELDVFADPAGGLYANRAGPKLAGQNPTSPDPAMRQPGFKVLHTQDIDFVSTCPTFVACLRQLKGWSDGHARHVPLVVLVEPVDAVLPKAGPIQFVVPVPIGTPELDALDAEIRSVFPADRTVSPDQVRGDRPTLEDAVLHGGWPTLGEARGKVVFVLLGKRDAYAAGHPSLEGRAMFVASEPGRPDAAAIVRDDPLRTKDDISRLVGLGYLVRTRADADTVEARSNTTARRDAALASGAQIVSTDYPVVDKRLGPYVVRIPSGTPARCDPVNAPPSCAPGDVERPAALR
jgi:hypothetical protein